MRTGKREIDRHLPRRCVERDAPSPRPGRRAHPHVRAGAGAERDAAAVPRQLPPQSRVRIVGVDHRRRIVGQVLDQLPLCAGDAFDAAEPFEMRRGALGDDPHRRPGQSGEGGDLAGMVRSELDHCGAVPGIDAAQRERDADLVVEIAAGGGDRARSPEDRGDHVLDRGLAVAPGDPDQEKVAEAAPPRRGEPAERLHRIAREDEGDRIVRHPLDQDRDGAAPTGVADEVMPVESRPAHRDEQRAGDGRTRIGADPVKYDVLARRLQTERCGRFAEAHPDHRHASSARHAAADVAERQPRPVQLLADLVPLAGDQHHIGRACSGDRTVNGPPPVALDADRAGLGEPLDDVGDDRVATLAAGIVVGDDDPVGARLRPLAPSAAACRGPARRRSRTRTRALPRRAA